MSDNSEKPKSAAPQAPPSSSSSSSPSSSKSSKSPPPTSSSSSSEMPQFPPGSTMWTAPQSLANPTAPAHPPQPHFLSPSSSGAGARALTPEEQQLAREQRRQATYFRRVTGAAPPVLPPPPSGTGATRGLGEGALAMGPKPSLLMRWSHIGSFVLSVGLGGWMVLFCDFGEREHVFSPIRRAVFGSSSLRISSQEEAWLQRGFKTRTPLAPVPDESSSSSSSSATADSGFAAGPTLR